MLHGWFPLESSLIKAANTESVVTVSEGGISSSRMGRIRFWCRCCNYMTSRNCCISTLFHVKCTCSRVLDEYGDHALGCGQLRIKRHDALCDVIYHCLLKENSGTRREQGCSTHSLLIGQVMFITRISLMANLHI